MLDPSHPLSDLLRRDKRYRLDAYVFVFDALRFAQENLGLGRPVDVEEEASEEDRHVSGQQLCEAIRLYALKQYGALAKTVLDHWGVRSTADFGELVFNLIEIGQMRKTDSDRREDFDGVYNFDEAFRETFAPLAPDPGQERRQ